MLLSISRLLATERAPNERKTIAGNCWHDKLNNLKLDLPQGTPKAWEEQLKSNEQYLNSLYFQQRGSLPPLQLLLPESWDQPLLFLSTAATCCGGDDAEKNLTGSLPWNWGEGRKKGEEFPQEKKTYKYSNMKWCLQIKNTCAKRQVKDSSQKWGRYNNICNFFQSCCRKSLVSLKAN